MVYALTHMELSDIVIAVDQKVQYFSEMCKKYHNMILLM